MDSLPWRFLIFGVSLWALVPSSARAARTGVRALDLPRRVALVIGNQDYPGKGAGQRGAAWGELQAPVNDARKMAAKLKAAPLSFTKVTVLLNLDRREMQRAIGQFYEDIKDADLAVFYFSGHGFSTGGQSYLVPVGVADRQVLPNSQPPKFISVQTVAAEIKRRAPYSLMFLDACRDEVGGGFLKIDGITSLVAGKGQLLVSYAAPLGRPANEHPNGSPYTTALLYHLDKPDLSVQQLMAEVGRSLTELTRDRRRSMAPNQELQLAGSINDPLYLAGQTDVGVLARTRELAKREQELWDEARASRNRDQILHYLRRYPEGRFALPAYHMVDHIDWDNARRLAKQTGQLQPIDAYLKEHSDGIHKKEALDWMRPTWKKPSLWLGLGAGIVTVAVVGLGIGLSMRTPDLSNTPGGNPADWMVSR